MPQEIYDAWNNINEGAKLENDWNKKFEKYKDKHPDEAAELSRRINSRLPENWVKKSQEFIKSLSLIHI